MKKNNNPIPMSFLKTKRGKRFYDRNAEMLVHIQSNNGFWMRDRAGYTDNYSRRGIYTLKEAYEATMHCGLEKAVRYFPIDKDGFLGAMQEVGETYRYMLKAVNKIL